MCSDNAPEWVIWIVFAPMIIVLWACCILMLKGAWMIFTGRIGR